MDFSELKTKSAPELTKLADELKKELQQLNLKASQKSLKQVHLINQKRKDVARVNTLLTMLARRAGQN